MTIQEELKLPKPLKNINHETLISIVRTNSLLMKRSSKFFSKYEITDIQFNILMILNEYSSDEGMSQQELSEKLIVSKSNVVGLIDRLEKTSFVERRVPANDRRINRVLITVKGKKLVSKLYDVYFREVDLIINKLTSSEKKSIIRILEKIRIGLKGEDK